MPQSKLVVAVEVLPDVLPMLSQVVTIVGSAEACLGSVALVIEGENVPDTKWVEAVVTKTNEPGATTLRFEMRPRWTEK